MAASATQNLSDKASSKSAKRKKQARSESMEASSAVGVLEVNANGVAESSNGDGSYESPYIKELYKNIRNVNKKITNASKVDNILAENSGKSLDELVAERKINADQKAQILKKPALQASLSQLEEQIAQYKKFDQEYKGRLHAEKADLEKSFQERANKELEEKVSIARYEAASAASQQQKQDLLLISQFLQLAAVRRGDEEANPSLDENKALEGLLAKVYSGDENAVNTMLKIAQGSLDTTISVTGEPLTTTYADVKAAAAVILPSNGSTLADGVAAMEITELPIQSDPTLANAGLTELDAPTTTSLVNGHAEPSYGFRAPQNSIFGEASANPAAQAQWDNNNDMSTSQEWVQVPRETAETDTGISATLAAPPNIQSWADDQPENTATDSIVRAPSITNDGFHEVHRSRGSRGRGDGHFRVRGRGGDGHRGRGFRAEGRGRGRGVTRGGGANRGRGSDES